MRTVPTGQSTIPTYRTEHRTYHDLAPASQVYVCREAHLKDAALHYDEKRIGMLEPGQMIVRMTTDQVHHVRLSAQPHLLTTMHQVRVATHRTPPPRLRRPSRNEKYTHPHGRLQPSPSRLPPPLAQARKVVM